MFLHWNQPRVRISATFLFAVAAVAAVEAAGPFRNPLRQRTSVEQLAEKIDKLERHIDAYGSVVAKTPDVWGEARLTKYRRDVESVLSDRLKKFEPTISATISRSDQAFLTSSLALQAALGGRQASLATPSQVIQYQEETTTIDENGNPVIVKTKPQVIAKEKISEQEIPGAASNLNSTPAFSNRNSLLTVQSGIGGFANSNAVGLEPTVVLDQLQRYLDHLNQLRRNNDGDDQSDSPGYAMHLVRLPVSVQPGNLTKEGYGAEISVIAKPHLHEKLLSETFRGLVINDIIDQLALPMAKFIDLANASNTISSMQRYTALSEELAAIIRQRSDYEWLLGDFRKREKQSNKELQDAADALLSAKSTLNSSLDAASQQAVAAFSSTIEDVALKTADPSEVERAKKVAPNGYKSDKISRFANELERIILANPKNLTFEKAIADASKQSHISLNRTMNETNRDEASRKYFSALETIASFDSDQQQLLSAQTDAWKRLKAAEDQYSKDNLAEIEFPDATRMAAEDVKESIEEFTEDIQQFEQTIKELRAALSSNGILTAVAAAPSRRAQLPFAPEQLASVYSYEMLGDIGQTIYKIKGDDHNNKVALLVDVSRVLADNLNNAYNMLLHRPELWQHCTRELAIAIRQNDDSAILRLRNNFDLCVPPEWQETPKDAKQPKTRKPVIAFAWAIIVESSLLNERLIEDMKLMQTAKNCFCLSTDWMDFYNPEPGPEVVAAFNQYVECRWPVHVFAIDPMTDDQNVVDSFSQRREMQLALSLAFASGKINAQKFMRYARTLDLDMQSIALNRTAVGFSHGDDTFGWRFYPRVQSPPSRGNLAVATRELLVGGFTQDQQLMTRRLEPGMRECTAIVLLPAFVPYAIFDFRTNWFKLTNPTKKEFDLEDGVEISKDIQSVRQLSQDCVKDAHKYRQSEVYMLTRAVDQLERRLPLQTTYVQIPFENSLGGFEFFNGGVPDLAPELHGFYGEPGISAAKDMTSTIYLVGENFSVHETEVVVGNRRLDPKKEEVQLLSRQVMRISVTGPMNALGDKVEIHVATPYGVSNHLEVPLIASADEAAVKALAEHEEKRHVDRFAWKETPTPTVVVSLDDQGNIAGVNLAMPDEKIELEVESKTVPSPALDSAFEALPLELAAWLTVKSSNDQTEAAKKAIGAWTVPESGKIKLTAIVGDGKFLKMLQSLPYGFGPSEIELTGFVRSPNKGHLPTLRMENTIKIKVAMVKKAAP